jgi:hypothetical protein
MAKDLATLKVQNCRHSLGWDSSRPMSGTLDTRGDRGCWYLSLPGNGFCRGKDIFQGHLRVCPRNEVFGK